MKSIVTIIILSLSVSVNAQYQSIFGDSSTSWGFVSPNVFMFTTFDEVSYVKDTVVGSIELKKLSNGIFIREDTTQGKVWEYNVSSGVNGWLLSDLSLSVGDSMHIPRSLFKVPVDSVYYQGGRKHVRFSRSYGSVSPTEKVVMIEGVGVTGNAFLYNDTPAWINYLTCQHKDGQVNFANNHPVWQGDCSPSLLSVEELTDEKIMLRPNPTKGIFKVETTAQINRVEIYSITGKKVMETKNTSLDISSFQNGVYVVKVHTEKGMAVKKIVKE